MTTKSRRDLPGLTMAVSTVCIPILIVLASVAILKVGFLISLVLGTAVACLFGLKMGYSWKELQAGMFKAQSRVSIVFLILMLVGTMVGVWILSGTIPFMLYWGLKMFSAKTFLVGTFIFCCIFSICTGTSFGTVATAGIAFLGVGNALGIPAGWTIGAVISGGWFGDKMSPASDTTNVAAGATGTNLYSHIGSMLYTTVPAAFVALIVYAVYGLTSNDVALPGSIANVSAALSDNFNLNILVAIPPVVFLVMSIKRVPAIPTIFTCIIVGMITAAIFQGADIKTILASASDGFKSQTGVEMVDGLLSRGGLSSMFFSIILIILAMSLGGAMEVTRSLETIVNAVLKKVQSTTGLIAAVLGSCYLMLLGTGDVMVSIVVCGRAYSDEFAKRGLSSRVLSRTLEDAATIAGPLMPWGVAPFFIFSMLSVTPFEYGPYAVLCYTVPVFSLICGLTGFGIFKAEASEEEKEEGLPTGKIEIETT